MGVGQPVLADAFLCQPIARGRICKSLRAVSDSFCPSHDIPALEHFRGGVYLILGPVL